MAGLEAPNVVDSGRETSPAAEDGADNFTPPATRTGAVKQEVIQTAPTPDANVEPKPKRLKRTLGLAALLAGVVAAGIYGDEWWTTGRFFVSTDDAYVKADVSIISAKVPGYITAVPVAENAKVAAGAVLAEIDPRDYRIAVDAARSKAATQESTIARLKEQAKAQNAVIEQAKAQVSSAKASLVRAKADFERATTLSQLDFSSRKVLDQARADRDQGQASLQSAEAGELLARANLEVLNAQVGEAEHVRDELQSSLDKALLDLNYATVRAPVAGIVGNKAVQVGQFVQAGTRMLSIVPLDTVYIEANFKETQLAEIRAGQPARISVDAAGGLTVDGVVESLAPASGSQYSILPPENATGNFTKIVQRVPVRIRVIGDTVKQGYLKPGLSVTAAVNTKRDVSQKNDPGSAAMAASVGSAP